MLACPAVVLLAAWLAELVDGRGFKVDSQHASTRLLDSSAGNMTAAEVLAQPRRAVVFSEETHPDKRQVCTTTTRAWYELVGDGNPHQNYRITQVADTIISCPGTIEKSHSYTGGWSASLGDKPVEDKSWGFSALGFGVRESYYTMTEQGASCGAGDGNMSEICMQISCGSWMGPVEDEGIGTVYLPNANGIGSTTVRGTNFGNKNIIQCRGDAERHVDYHCGPKGRPEFWDTTGPGPWAAKYTAAVEPPDCVPSIEALHFIR